MSRPERPVYLAAGVLVPRAALRLLWTLEGRGLHLSVVDDEVRAWPKQLLTDADTARLRGWARYLRVLLAPTEVQ